MPTHCLLPQLSFLVSFSIFELIGSPVRIRKTEVAVSVLYKVEKISDKHKSS